MIEKFTIPTDFIDLAQRVESNKHLLSIHKRKNHISEINQDPKIAEMINGLSITESELIEILGQRWKSNLATIGGFIEKYQYITSEKDVSVMPIATTSDFMLNLCGSKQNAINLVKQLKAIHLLTQTTQVIDVEKLEFDKNGQIVSKYVEKKEINNSYIRGLCNVYYYSKSIQNIIKTVINKHNITIKQVIKTNNNHSKYYTTKGQTFDFDTSKIRFNSKLSIPCTEKDFEEKIVYPSLYKNYPQLEHYQELADRMNQGLNQANQISFVPKITYSKSKKYISKIGIRATNPLVSAKKEDDGNKDFFGKYKDDVLNEQIGSKWFEFDVKSSVPRVQYLLTNGIWLSNDTDIYELIYNEMESIVRKSDSKYYTTKGQTFAEIRPLFKSMFMRGYFDKASTMVNHIMPALLGKANESTVADFDDYYEQVKKSAEFLCKSYREAIENVLGKTVDSEIFLHESCIYLDVASKIRQLGAKLVQIYDGFYTDEKVDCIEEIIKQCAESYYNQYVVNKSNNQSVSIDSMINQIVDNNNQYDTNKENGNHYTTKVQTFDFETEKDIKAMVESVLEVKDNPCTFYSRMPSDVWTKYADCWIEFRKTDIYKKVLEDINHIPSDVNPAMDSTDIKKIPESNAEVEKIVRQKPVVTRDSLNQVSEEFARMCGLSEKPKRQIPKR